MNDSNAMRKRLLKYVGPVTLLAFAFNIVKFFEAKVEYRPLGTTISDAPVLTGENGSLVMVPNGGEDVHVITRSANNYPLWFQLNSHKKVYLS